MPAAVSSETLNQPVDLQRVRSCLSELCASPGEFDRFFADVFGQLDLLSGQLLHRQESWRQEQSEAEAQYRRRLEQLQQCQAELTTAVVSGEAAAGAGESDEQRQQALALVEQERARLASVREETEKHAQELAQATAELGQTRQELQELLGTVRAGVPAPAGSDGQSPQVAELQQERARLEAELEMVRNRAAEMSESLAQQKREMTQERAQWAEELKRMRHLLENQSVAPSAPAREPDAPAAERPAAKAGNAESDPVLDSVMAQFEILQKDLARRRKQQTPSAG